jgi:transmembrane sensor
MKYENYKAEDFFDDENFRNWILKNDPALNFFWEKWILQNPDKKADIAAARKLVLGLNFKDEHLTAEQKESIWNKVEAENKQYDQSLNTDSKILPIHRGNSHISRSRSFAWYFYRMAAAMLLLLAAWIMLMQESSIPEVVDNQQVIIHKENPPGQKSKIYLTDGTVVFLNGSSRISYPENFDADKRQVHLEGEAYFEVAKDTVRPFIVESGALQTRVLGTKFNISAFPDSKTITVSLLEGRVEVMDDSEDNKLILEDRQAVSYNLINNKLNKVSFNYIGSIQWKDGILFFQKATMPEVVVELERWYGVEISILGSPVDPILVSGRFENESLANVLNSLAFSNGFDFKIEGKKVSINF